MNQFYTSTELAQLGLKYYGKDVLISRKASIYSANTIEIGSNIRIDDFCILSGNIKIGNNVHISAGSKLYGQGSIEFQDYSGCSANCTIYSATDDFSGDFMIGSMAPEQFRHVISGKVTLEKYSQLGANTIVMPDVTVAEGAATGSLTFVNQNLEPWTIYIGIPCRKLKERNRKLLSYINNGR